MAPKSTKPEEKRCVNCINRPYQCRQCSGKPDTQHKRTALRKKARETGDVTPALAKYRKQCCENEREQRQQRKKYGIKFKNDERKCKGPDGQTGTCGKTRVSSCSPAGYSFCTACYTMAYPAEAATVRAACRAARAARPKRSAGLATKKKCAGQEPIGSGKVGKVCPNPISGANPITAALQRAGMSLEEARAAMQAPGILKIAVDAHDRSGQCYPCFLKAHPTHAQTLKDRTQCKGTDGAGSRCQRSATEKGLCGVHSGNNARILALPCRNAGSTCASGESRACWRGLCQPCLDAFELIVDAHAARFTPAEPPSKRRKKG
jgi:hypothetical protein